jgi:hypothetical protein
MEGPKILLVDIETSAALGWSWVFYDTNLIDTLRDWSIICYSAKWLGGKQVTHAIDRPKSLFSFIKDERSDLKLVKELWKLLDEADYVCGHNARSFDCKKINSRFLHYGIPPPSPYKVLDTKVITKSVSNNTRNNQGVLLKDWGIGFKLENEGWPLWLKFMSGDRKARRDMMAYNKQDTIGLEALYKRLLPWMKQEQGMFRNGTVCPHCSSKKLQSRGWLITKTQKYKRVYCEDCGGWSRVPCAEKGTKPLVSL